ncbi:MAG: hypothetical protein IKU61_05700 [Clostridia bacterium]|nr:hypothetical protein [Clostridia bacterium]
MSRISKLKDPEYHIDFDEKEVFHGNERVAKIQNRHLNILELLAKNAGRLVKKEVIISSCLEYTSDSNYYNAFTHIRRHIHKKVEESIEKCSGGFRYLGGPITEDDVRRIESGVPVVTELEDELLRRSVALKIREATGRVIDRELMEEIDGAIIDTIDMVRKAVWDDFEFRIKMLEVLTTYMSMQLVKGNDAVLSLNLGGK